MKKVLFAGILALFLAAFGFVFFFLEEEDLNQALPVEGSASEEETQAAAQPQLGVRKNAETDADIQEALDYEKSQNADTVGWLRIPGTDINNSVLQAHDNMAYLRRDERKRDDVYGCYFADYTCDFGSREELSPNTVIYGHSDLQDNPDGPRFSQLFRFTDPEFAAQTPYIRFGTLEELMDWQVFAVFYTDVSMDYIRSDLTGADFSAIVDEAKSKSLYDYGVEVGEDDKLLTLSTCTIKYGKEDTEHRFVVMAKLVPAGANLAKTAQLTQKPQEEVST